MGIFSGLFGQDYESKVVTKDNDVYYVRNNGHGHTVRRGDSGLGAGWGSKVGETNSKSDAYDLIRSDSGSGISKVK